MITGAGGYVGGRLAAYLGALGRISVRALGRALPPDLVAGERVELDLLGDPRALDRALEGVGTVVHLAGHNEVVAAREPERALTETVLAGARLARAAVAAGVRRLVYVSTVHAYGARIVPGAVLSEDLAPAPRSVYAIARVASEHLLEAAGEGGAEVVVFRLTNCVGAPAGPYVNRWSLVAADLCRQAVMDGRLSLRSPGDQWRDFIAVSDVCRILAGCLAPGSLPAGTYNLGSGSCLTIRGLAALVQDAMEAGAGFRPPLSAPPLPERPALPYRVSVDRLAGHGWRAGATVASGVEETLRFCLEHRHRL